MRSSEAICTFHLGFSLDGQPFLITEAGEHDTHIDFQFFNHGLTWTDGQEVEVRLAVNRPATGAPAITGTAHVGKTITADTSAIDDPDGITGATFTYQWVRSDGTDTDISGATDSTYTLVAADVGKTIKVKVSFTDNAKFPESLTSEATAEVELHTTEIWSATLTVKAEPSAHGNNWGWNSKGDYPGSGLTSTSFPYFGQPREILEIRNHRGLTRLRVRISPAIPSITTTDCQIWCLILRIRPRASHRGKLMAVCFRSKLVAKITLSSQPSL